MPRIVACLLFPGFELLDVAAPLELLGAVGQETLQFRYVTTTGGENVQSSLMEASGSGQGGPRLQADFEMAPDGAIRPLGGGRNEEAYRPNVLFVPGGVGTRRLVSGDDEQGVLSWIADCVQHCEIVFSVCTGSWVLARAGVLDGLEATSNKAVLRLGQPQRDRPQVMWQASARWVVATAQRGGREQVVVTSSGVSAGGDAALAVVAMVAGQGRAREIATAAEWLWNEDPNEDPFALDQLID